jgi:hypothetical protein
MASLAHKKQQRKPDLKRKGKEKAIFHISTSHIQHVHTNNLRHRIKIQKQQIK